MRKLAFGGRRFMCAAATCSVILAGCSNYPDHGPDQLAGSFDLCSGKSAPEPVDGGRLSVESPEAPPGGTIVFRWSLAEDVLLGPDLVAYCWSEDEWVPVWITRDVFTRPSVELVEPGQELHQSDHGFAERVGTVMVPREAPPGTYRLGFESDDVRIEVTG